MAVAASRADIALVLVDATKGVREQTLRHLTICAFMGVEKIIIIVNKLDQFDFFILSNLSLLPDDLVWYLSSKKYIIIEHDFKFIRGRNILIWQTKVDQPKINAFVELYKNAQTTFVQTKFHQQVFEENQIASNFYNLDCSVWSIEELSSFESILGEVQKTKDFCIVQSLSPIKGTPQAIDFCKRNNIEFDLISNKDYNQFLRSLRQYKSLVFFPILAETCSRLAVEAKCLGCDVISWYKYGATDSSWFYLQEKELIEYLRVKSEKNLKYIYESI